MLQAIAARIGLEERGRSELSDEIVRTLGPRSALLLLDNCEHLLAPVAGFVDAVAVPLIEIPELRREAGPLAARFYRHPSRQLHVVGVTGTNGKTTTTRLVAQLGRLLGRRCGVIGTLGAPLGDEVAEAGNTTPDPVALQRQLAEWRDLGVNVVSMEVSSHALVQGRVNGIEFETAVYTNLSHDHLDFHGSMDAYGRAKLAGEEGVIASGCRQLIFRTSWVYSAGGNNFLKTMLRFSAERDKLQVIDDQWGAPTGATLIAEVTAKAIDVASGSAAMHGIYHLAPAGETTWYRYARFLIQRARNVGWPVIVSPDDIVPVGTEAFSTPAKRPLNSRLDCHRLEQSLGMRMPDWREGVAAVVDEIAATAAKRTSS